MALLGRPSTPRQNKPSWNWGIIQYDNTMAECILLASALGPGAQGVTQIQFLTLETQVITLSPFQATTSSKVSPGTEL